jgi:glycerol-3-phosphate dehydrogenase (NAD(P)+)
MEIGVIGAGSWGTALAKVLADKGEHVTLWGRGREHTSEIAAQHENARYLPGIKLPANLDATDDLARACAGKQFLVSVVPSHTVRDVLGRAAPSLDPETIVISA